MSELSADWRRIPLRQCQECPKLVPAAQERCNHHERKGCGVSARVAVNSWGAWVGYCPECNTTTSGHPSRVQLWADVHNSDHRSGQPNIIAIKEAK